MDDGWTADALRAALVDVSGRELPQPLDYLISDVARRHGTVRVWEVRAVVTGSDSDLAEIAHTRSLRSLQLVAVAPTVLTSPSDPAAVLTGLRGAGFTPMPEAGDGAVIVAARATSAPAPATRRRAPRARVDAPDLAARLLAGRVEQLALTSTEQQLLALAPHLDNAEIAVLADALDHDLDVRIRYRNAAGNRTTRDIRPRALFDRWLGAWCHLR